MAFTNNEHLTRGYAIEAYEVCVTSFYPPFNRTVLTFPNYQFRTGLLYVRLLRICHSPKGVTTENFVVRSILASTSPVPFAEFGADLAT